MVSTSCCLWLWLKAAVSTVRAIEAKALALAYRLFLLDQHCQQNHTECFDFSAGGPENRTLEVQRSRKVLKGPRSSTLELTFLANSDDITEVEGVWLLLLCERLRRF